ncbi:MAG: UDP-N-acetylmuramoyl-L-alanine--D-glutamate ligase [Candidatus Kerfeldbacteria bacterium]|nr:UDP-N-acetylmuramoyl-L-alanine--D-glutamate ligase [Candidatus Kerfeldbacteria bacterium]
MGRNVIELKGKNVGVLGFGVEGLSVVEWLLNQDCRVSVFDEQPGQKFDAGLVSLLRAREVQFFFGPFPDLAVFEVLVRSPGVPLSHRRLKQAQQRQVRVTTLSNLFFERCPCPIIGITGTKGKGTTATLIFEILKAAGRDAYLGGNIGTPGLDFLDELDADSLVVLELSSFQLMDIESSPQIAVVLMVTSEHLDYHESHNEYVTSKAGIVKFQPPSDAVVVNVDYENSLKIVRSAMSRRLEVSTKKNLRAGCFLDGDAVVTVFNGQRQEVVAINQVKLLGRHNLENVCAAVGVAKLLNVANNEIAQTIRTFRGLPHRLQLVAEISGVKYVNDSYSTTPETAMAAIQAFPNTPKILILGGSSKRSDFAELGKILASDEFVKAIIGIGQEWPRIKAAVGKLPAAVEMVEDCRTMQEIVQQARKRAKRGDVVLFSPACASFDMFKSYKDRGEQFMTEVLRRSKKA